MLGRADVADVGAAVLAPETLRDRLAQRVGPAGIARGRLRVALLTSQPLAQAQRLVMQHVGGQREGTGNEPDILARPGRIGLLAPVQERGLAAVQADARVERERAILRQRGRERGAGIGGKGRIIQQVPRSQEPHHAVAAHRPAAAGAGVLRHEQPRQRVGAAHRRQLEAQRAPRALRIQPRQGQVRGIADIAGPHVGPALAGLVAIARQRLAVIERRVADRLHLVVVQLLLRQREQRIEQRTVGLAAQRLCRHRACALGRVQHETAVGSDLGLRGLATPLQ
ncbi:hypothetical protein NB689_002690 [Xanthomonas sacchari]|nr:hypothetical protein [Xanthomonas sacchari]